MAKKATNWWMWAKMFTAGAVVIAGGSELVKRVRPTDEELRARYNPELRQRSLEQGTKQEQEFDEFVTKLKKASRSSKHIWIELKELEEQEKKAVARRRQASQAQAEAQRAQMRQEAGLDAK